MIIIIVANWLQPNCLTVLMHEQFALECHDEAKAGAIHRMKIGTMLMDFHGLILDLFHRIHQCMVELNSSLKI